MLARISAFIKRAWAAAPVATTILALALAASLVFGVRSAMFWSGHFRPVDREQPVAEWMTPRLLARSWHVPPEVILDAIDMPRPPPRRAMSLAQIAEYRGVPVEQVIAEAEAAIAAFRQTQGDAPLPEAAPETTGE